MEPIINPWVFYIAELAENLKSASFVAATISALIWVFLVVPYICEDRLLTRNVKKVEFIIKGLSIIFVISCCLHVFLPSKETIYAMVISSVITPDNVNYSIEYIIGIIEKNIN